MGPGGGTFLREERLWAYSMCGLEFQVVFTK